MGGTYQAILTAGLVICLGLSGCYHYRVASPNVADLNQPVSETKWSLFWGLVQEDDTSTSCACKNNGIKEVTASSNLGYMLLGVLTVGVVAPLQLEYVCGKPPPGAPFPDPPKNCGDQVLLEPPADPEFDPAPDVAPEPASEPISEPGPEPEPNPDQSDPETPTLENDPDEGSF